MLAASTAVVGRMGVVAGRRLPGNGQAEPDLTTEKRSTKSVMPGQHFLSATPAIVRSGSSWPDRPTTGGRNCGRLLADSAVEKGDSEHEATGGTAADDAGRLRRWNCAPTSRHRLRLVRRKRWCPGRLRPAGLRARTGRVQLGAVRRSLGRNCVDRKILWGRTGSRCSICKRTLVQKGEAAGSTIQSMVTGSAAPLVELQSGSQRGPTAKVSTSTPRRSLHQPGTRPCSLPA
jgi:hypothetical protein